MNPSWSHASVGDDGQSLEGKGEGGHGQHPQGGAVPEEAVSCAVSLDGVRPDGDEEVRWCEASCGTVSFQDTEGNRLKTLSLGPEVNRTTLKAQLAEEVAHVCKVRPDLQLVAVAVAALDNWTVLEKFRSDERRSTFSRTS